MSIKNTDFKEELDILFKAILKLENEDECYKFFEDIGGQRLVQHGADIAGDGFQILLRLGDRQHIGELG